MKKVTVLLILSLAICLAACGKKVSTPDEMLDVVKEKEWGLPWIDYDNRPPFKIWVSPEEIAPFFFVEHHPVSLSLLLYISDHYKSDIFWRAGLDGNSQDWKKLAKRLIKDYEEDNSGIDMFQFDCDDAVFCI